MNDTLYSHERYRKAFILFLVIGVTSLFIFMIRDFLIAVLLAGIFSGLLYPVYHRLLQIPGLNNHPGLTSASVLLLAFIAIGIPLAGLLGMVTAEAVNISDNIVPWAKELITKMNLSEQLPEWLPFADQLDPYKSSILAKLGEATSAAGKFLVRSGSALTQGTVTFLLNLFIMLYSMFCFLLWGPKWIKQLAVYLPLTGEDRQKVLHRGLSVTRASLKGILVIGVLQGVLVGLAFWVLGLTGAAFWGTIVVILSAVPGAGAPLIWVPAALYLFIIDRTGAGIGLIIWGAVVVGTIDNILRPRIVGVEARMSDLLILLSTLGGIVMFGAVGIIIGPVIAAGMVTILDIYRHAFIKELPDNE
jgi:predicted PurR-regulated permease PerM